MLSSKQQGAVKAGMKDGHEGHQRLERFVVTHFTGDFIGFLSAETCHNHIAMQKPKLKADDNANNDNAKIDFRFAWEIILNNHKELR